MLTLLNLTLQLFKCLHIKSNHQVQSRKRRHYKVNRPNESAFYSFRKYQKAIANVILISYITMPGALLADGLSAAAGSANAPTFDTAANGVPIVNINAPTSKGVSRNEYQDLNVDSKGLIFNNSPNIISTDLAGYIDGNANLKGNSASIILNEVTGSSHSALNGYMEIAGQEAELVIANRHGITCNGCGFINTTRGVLTTGEAIINNGALEGYNVAQGQVTIEELGLNSPETEQIDILARSIAVNGELWANQTTLISGQNNIKHLRDNEGDLTVRTLTKDEVDATTINSTKSQGTPTFALDVAAIGGMYANRITLIGTETGLGVNNDGNLVATEKMVLQADGTITNSGALTADSISITHYNEPSAIALNNQGDIATQNSLSIDANKINNNGNIIAQGDNTVTAKAIENQGNITSGANLLITTTTLTNGTDTQGNKATLKGLQVNLQTASLANGTQGQIVSNERLLINDAGQAADINNAGILLAQDIDLTVSTLDNSGAIISQTALDIDANIVTNSGNLVATNNNTITANTVENQGNITSGANLLIITDALTNSDTAQLIATDDLTVSNAEQAVLINNAGILSAQNSILQATELTNSGDIVASNTSTINANSLSNSGNIVATNDNTITANSVDNQGNIVSDANLLIITDTLTNSDSAQLVAANDLTVSNAEQAVLINNAGILSAQNATLLTSTLINSGDVIANGASIIEALTFLNTGNIVATENNTVTADSVDNQGNIVSDGNLLITANTLTNGANFQGKKAQLKGLQVDLQTQQLTNGEQGQIISEDTLTINNEAQSGTINNSGELLAQNARLFASTLDNSNNIISQNTLTLNANTLTNNGIIVSVEDATINADTLLNKKTISGNNLTLDTNSLENKDSDALILGRSSLVVNADQALNQNGAVIYSLGDDATITVTNTLTNSSATIETSGNLTINANKIINRRDGEFAVINTTIDNGAQTESDGAIISYVHDEAYKAFQEIIDEQYESDHDTQDVYSSREKREMTEAAVADGIIIPILANQYRYTQTTMTPIASTENADAGQIIAASNLTINASIDNLYSTITAGKALNYKGELNNQAFTAERIISKNGVKSTTVREGFSDDDDGGHHWYENVTTTKSYSENNKSTVVLASAIFTANNVINGSGGDVINTGGDSNTSSDPETIVTPTTEVDDIDVKAISDTSTKEISEAGIEEIDESSTSKANEHATALLDASSALFNNANENSPYLYETNPAFTSYQNFVSSDYFIEKLDLNTRDTKRVGDGFYEQQLIKNQLIDLTGVQFLNEQNNAEDQYIALMNNALTQYETINLTPGQALTDEQRAGLTQPIVWMVEEQVETDSGLQTVLVPRVYLPSSMDMMLREDGAMIAANTVNIDADNFENSGLVRAQDSLTVNANDINNTGTLSGSDTVNLTAVNNLTSTNGVIDGGNVNLDAGNDVNLIGSKINATEGISVIAGNDINLAAIATTEVTGFSDEKTTTTTHQTTALSAANITFNAGNTFTSEAANISAIDALNISARNIDLLAVVDSTSQSNNNGYKQQSNSQSERAIVTNLTSGGALTLNATNDIYSEGAGLNAGGDIAFTADNDILLSTVITTQSTDGKRGNTKTSSEDITNQGTSVTSDGNIQFSSGNDLTLYGSTANAEGSIGVDAGGDVQLLAAVDQASESYYSKKKSTFKVKIKSSGSVEQTAVASGFTANNGDLNVEADGNISTEGATLASTNGTLSLGAGGAGAETAILDENGNYVNENGETIGNITLGTKELHNSSWNESSSSLRGGLDKMMTGITALAAYATGGMSLFIPYEIEVGKSDSTRTDSTIHAVTTVNTTNLDIDAVNDVAFIGTDVTATDTANIDAKNVTIDAALNTTTHTESHSTQSMSSDGPSLSKETGEATLVSLSEIEQTDTTTTTSNEWQGARFDVGNLNINAEEDVAIIASDIDVTNDANIEGQNVLVGGREDTVETTTESITKTETLTVGATNAYVDVAYAVKALNDAKNDVLDATSKLNEARKEYADGLIEEKDLLSYMKVLASATKNAVEAGKGVALSYAQIAATSSTYGFSASGSVSTKTDESSIDSTQGVWSGASLNIGGNTNLSSENELTIQGSEINSSGEISIDAGNVSIVAGTNTTTEVINKSSKGKAISANTGGSVSASTNSSESTSSSEMITSAASSLNGGSIVIRSDNDLLIEGAGVTAVEALSIEAQSVSILAANNTASESTQKSGKNISAGYGGGNISGAVSSSEGTNNSQSNIFVGSSLSGGSLDIKSASELLVQGSSIAAKEDLNIEAVDITITEIIDSNNSSSDLSKSGFTASYTEKNSVSAGVDLSQETNSSQATASMGSSLSGGGITLVSGNDLTIKGSNVNATEVLNLDATNISVLAGTNTSTENTLKKIKRKK